MTHAAPIQAVQADPAPATGLRKRYLDSEHRKRTSEYIAHLQREIVRARNIDSIVESAVEPGPDIQWMPNYETYKARVAALEALGIERQTRVPEKFPDKVIEPWVWSGDDFESEDEFVVRFSEDDVKEIEEALKYYKEWIPSLDPDLVSRRTFPLPTLASRLENVAQDIHNGIGFVILRGLEPRRYSAMDNVIIYLGVTSYIAPIRGVQNSSGNMLSEFISERCNSEANARFKSISKI
jgi:hypothetical protein